MREICKIYILLTFVGKKLGGRQQVLNSISAHISLGM